MKFGIRNLIFKTIGLLWTFAALLLAPEFAVQATQSPIQVIVNNGVETVVYDRSVALLIAVDQYKYPWPNLPYVPLEMQDLKAELERHGFQVTIERNPKSSDIYPLIQTFLTQPLGPKSRAIVYFSGHGYTDKNLNGFILGTDAIPSDDPAFLQKATSMLIVKGLAVNSRARQTLIMLDSCYSGAIFTSKSEIAIRQVELSTLTQPSVQYLTSGSADQRSAGQSKFEQAVVAGLKGGAMLGHRGFIEAKELALYVSQNVPGSANQTPQFGEELPPKGDMLFFPPLSPETNKPNQNVPAKNIVIAADQNKKINLLEKMVYQQKPASEAVEAQRPSPATNINFAKKFPQIQVFYYRKVSDGLGILNALNKDGIPYEARKAELPDKNITDSVGCGPTTPIDAVKQVALSMLDAGVPIKSIYTYENWQVKTPRIQLNAYLKFSGGPVLTRDAVGTLTECPKTPLHL